MGDYCERCSAKPNSNWKNGICQCNTGYADINGKCTLRTASTQVISCSIAGVFLDNSLQKCFPCSDGCLACKDTYECTQCRPDYTLDTKLGLCIEICGDSKRYSLPCDDGNNKDGDGCSKDCKIEVGYSCTGGSPASKDACNLVKPAAIAFENKGQTRLTGKVVLNINVNYLPLSLINSVNDCSNGCGNVLAVQVTGGNGVAPKITSRYIPGTSFLFSVEIDFSKEPVPQFSAKFSVNQALRTQYFSGVDVSPSFTVDVNPAFLSRADGKNDELLWVI